MAANVLKNLTLKKCCALARCSATTDLKTCSACSEVLYCSREHQVEHFKEGGHKMICPGRQKGPPLTFQECSEKAQQYHSDQMWNAALPYYGAMLELTQRVVGLVHPQVGSLLQVIATIYRMTAKYEPAIQCLQKLLIVKGVNDGGSMTEYKEAFTITGLMAELYIQANNIPLAKEMLKKVEEIAVKEFGEDSFERGRCLCALGTVHETAGEHEDAERYMRQAVELSNYANPTDINEKHAASNGFYNLGVILFARQRYVDSLPLFQKSLELRTAAQLPPEHRDMQEVQAFLEECNKAVNDPNYVFQPPVPPEDADAPAAAAVEGTAQDVAAATGSGGEAVAKVVTTEA